MTQRSQSARVLDDYFKSIGKVLSAEEYRKRTDTPIRYARVKSIFGSWNRMENILRIANSRNEKPEGYIPATNVDEILAANAAELEAAEKARKEASQDLFAKTLEELEAQKKAEELAELAKDPEALNKLKAEVNKAETKPAPAKEEVKPAETKPAAKK